MKKSKIIIVATMLVILTLAITLFSGCVKPAKKAEADLNFDGLGTAPTQEAIEKANPIDKSKITLSDTMTENQAVLDSIEYLLRLSNKNLIESDFFTAAAYGTGVAAISSSAIKEPIVGSMDLREVRVFDDNTYYMDSYCLVTDSYTLKKNGKHGSVPSGITSAVASALNYAKRVYSPDSQTFYFSKNGKTTENSIKQFPNQNAVSYSKPETQKMTYKQYMKETNSRDSFKAFTTDNYDTEKPIVAGMLKYDESAGIYYLECDINCDDKTLEASVKDMTDIKVIKTFKYAKKHLTIEIWDCGLIRTYINSNTWNASFSLFGLKGKSDNYYEQWFMYDKSKLDILLIPESLKNQLMK